MKRKFAATAMIAGMAVAGCASTHDRSATAVTPTLRCTISADALEVSADVCEGLTTHDWTGWEAVNENIVRATFAPGEHHEGCWFWVDDTSITVCEDGAVATS